MNLFLIGLRNLFGEKGRLAITIGGVAFSVTLILVLFGLYQGWSTQMTKFLGGIPSDFWVGQKGSREISHSISILPSTLKETIQAEPNVSKVDAFIGRQVSFEKGGKEIRILLVGLDKSGTVRPFKIVEGKNFPNRGEIILDQTTAKSEKLKIGDKININNTELAISGISEGGNLLIYSYAFAEMGEAQKIFDFKNFVNYLLVKTNALDFKEDLEDKFPNLEAMPKQDFLDNNSALVKDTFLPIIGVLLLIAFIIGIAVIGLTIYTATIEKSQEYGVLKAIGYTNGQLFSIALIQSIIAGVLGLIIGNLLTLLVVKLATMKATSFIYEVKTTDLILVALITLVMSMIAAIIPLKRLSSIDPANVFKA